MIMIFIVRNRKQIYKSSIFNYCFILLFQKLHTGFIRQSVRKTLYKQKENLNPRIFSDDVMNRLPG